MNIIDRLHCAAWAGDGAEKAASCGWWGTGEAHMTVAAVFVVLVLGLLAFAVPQTFQRGPREYYYAHDRREWDPRLDMGKAASTVVGVSLVVTLLWPFLIPAALLTGWFVGMYHGGIAWRARRARQLADRERLAAEQQRVLDAAAPELRKLGITE
jgi:hypothetical protein